MTLTKAIPVRNAAPTPLDGRLADMAQVVANLDGTPRIGVLAHGQDIVTALGTMAVAVAAAEFVVSKGKADGVLIFTNDGTVNVAIAAAPASNSRIDVIYVKHNDNTTGDASSLPIFGVAQGTAAASPTKPAIPTGALELATLRVYAGTTAANGGSNLLTNTYPTTAMRGGVVPFRTKAELDAWTNAKPGQIAYTLDEQHLYTATGGAAWMPITGEWITYTPTLTGITLGSGGSVSARYRKVGRRVELRVRVAFGTGGAVTSQPIIGLPITTEDGLTEWFDGTGMLKDANGSEWFAIMRKTGIGGQFAPYVLSNSLAYSAFANVAASIPFTWTSGDTMVFNLSYDVA